MLQEVGSRTSLSDDGYEITLRGTKDEIDAIRAMLNGAKWLRVGDQGLEAVERFKPIPSPIDDPQIPPKWTAAKAPPVGTCTPNDLDAIQRQLDAMPRPKANVAPEIDPNEGWHSPRFYVSHLGAGGHEYLPSAKLLTEYGFECLRSRRGRDGKYWEVWYLPGTMFAGGALREAVETIEARARDAKKAPPDWTVVTKTVIDFLLKKRVSFGSLDVAVQRACLVYE